jgi:hypothetical protein
MNWPASLAAPLLRAVIFVGREDRTTRAVAHGVVCCKSFASGNRRTALVSSDMRNEIPKALLRQ